MAKVLSSSAACGTQVGAGTPAFEKKDSLSVAQLPLVMAAMLAAVPKDVYQSSGSPCGKNAPKTSPTDPHKPSDMETDSTVDAWSADEFLSSSDSDAEAEEVCSRGNSEATLGAGKMAHTPEPINVVAWGGVGLRLLACLQDDSDDEFLAA